MDNRNIDKNTFRKIPSLKFLYEVNPYGIVRNSKSKKVLKQYLDKNKYAVVTITNGNIHSVYRIHRLVAECYVDNLNNYPVVNHKDENKLNNYYKNLEWCTVAYNNTYGSRLSNISKTISNNLNNFVYYAVEFDKTFETSRDAATYIKQNYPEYKASIATIMRGIREVSETGKKYRFKTTWKRINKITTSND